MHIVSAIVHESVNTHGIRNSAVPVSEILRILRIVLEIIYHDPLQRLHLGSVSDEHAWSAA